jgi:hypothetical protein
LEQTAIFIFRAPGHFGCSNTPEPAQKFDGETLVAQQYRRLLTEKLARRIFFEALHLVCSRGPEVARGKNKTADFFLRAT